MNRREYEAFEDEYLTHEARTLYVLCLRRHMDYKTGLVGTAKRRVDMKHFMEYLSISRPRGSTKDPFNPKPKMIRGYLAELERVGLIERMPKPFKMDYMVFRLPLATSDLNRPNEEGQRKGKEEGQEQGQEEGQEEGREEGQAETLIKQRIESYEGQEEGQEQRQEQGQEEGQRKGKEEGHTSVSSVINTSHTHNAREAESLASFDQRFGGSVDAHPVNQSQPDLPASRKFAMYSDWQPDHTFTDQAKTLGLDLTTLDSEQGERIEQALVEFRTYRMESNPSEINTQRLWQQKFIQTSLKRELEQQRGNAHGNGHRKGSGQHSGSAMSRPFTEADFDLDATW
ncbi:hypothetical protein GZ77_20605 [Endozoicomonas montiporae]|uniref:DnaT DNA-binding domain-containing protein n=2 Tax=Endozoicomonas montiporae TaxID=1027273 RepID=A0A081N324_9GAMM|nr:DnaT-like ssDNA-binding domain-containing protein [Endozoicomonas montiporae]AMO58138.1 replication protein O of bacteriophage [Endozoicomonas montiporae CL-33]KEQ12847.1 hypothetical protein GZ77_20605 [Endozoicomonas montiporae]